MDNARPKTVTVSSIVGTRAYQKGVQDGYRNRPLSHPSFETHSVMKNGVCYEYGRFVGVYLRVNYKPIPKNRDGSRVTTKAINAFVGAQREGYL